MLQLFTCQDRTVSQSHPAYRRRTKSNPDLFVEHKRSVVMYLPIIQLTNSIVVLINTGVNWSIQSHW
jgi:hypothetical protein